MICLKCKGKDTMVPMPVCGWTEKAICRNCGTIVVTHHHDLMSGCMESKTEEWTDTDNNLFQVIEYDREGNPIDNKPKVKRHTIEVEITENDIEDFKNLVYRGKSFDWVYETTDKEASITIQFAKEEEENDND